MNKKNKHLDCYTDNLAFPEVHVEDVKTENVYKNSICDD